MERRLAAIVAMDMAGYTRLMQADEIGTLAAVKSDRATIIEPKVSQYNGRTIKLMGDGALMEFPSVVKAVGFAVEIQLAFKTRNVEVSEDGRIRYRVGINVGDVIAEDDDIYGEGVNLASRLEGLAEPGGICVGQTVREEVRDKLALDFKDKGEVEVKNVSRPVRVYSIRLNDKAEAFATPIVAPPVVARGKFQVAVVAIVGVCFVVAFSGLAWWQPWADRGPSNPERPAQALPKKPSIAILPFADLEGAKDRAYVVDGFTNAITANLSKFHELFVISSNSTFTYKGKTPNAGDVARDLGVRYVLAGSYEQTPRNVRITAQLIDGVEGTNVWAENYDAPREQIIEIQEDLTRRISTTLVSVIRGQAQSRALRIKDEDSLKAYDLYLRAFHFRLGKAPILEGIADLQRAIELEPDFAAAYSLLALRFSQLWRLNLADDPQDALRQARVAAQEAMALDPQDYRIHELFCSLYLYADRQHELALSECERAVSLNPNDAGIQITLAQVLTFMGRAKEGLKWVKSAKRLNPLYPPLYDWTSGFVNAVAGNYEKAIVDSRKALAAYPKSLSIRRVIIVSLVELGRLQEAKKTAEELLAIAPGFTLAKLRNAPFQHESEMNWVLGNLRKAGIPEE